MFLMCLDHNSRHTRKPVAHRSRSSDTRSTVLQILENHFYWKLSVIKLRFYNWKNYRNWTMKVLFQVENGFSVFVHVKNLRHPTGGWRIDRRPSLMNTIDSFFYYQIYKLRPTRLFAIENWNKWNDNYVLDIGYSLKNLKIVFQLSAKIR